MSSATAKRLGRDGVTANARLAAALFLAAFVLAGPLSAKKPPKPTTNDFLLRAPAAQIEAIAERNGLEIIRVLEVSADALGRSVYEVRAPAYISPQQVMATVRATEPEAIGVEEVFLASLPETAGADLDQQTMAILGGLQDPSEVIFGHNPDGSDRRVWGAYVNQPAALALRIDEATAKHPGEATVAIIDTGVDPHHPLLAGALVPGYDFLRDEAGDASEWLDLLDQQTMAILGQQTMAILGGENAVPVNASTTVVLAGSGAGGLDPATLPPAFGHGTMVAGIVHRVAPAARLMPLRAFDGSGRGNLVDIVRAIYYAIDHGANVINMSFSLETFSAELMRAVNYATRNGVACVAAAGNEGLEAMIYPAALGNALGVASTDALDYLSRFSNRGGDLVSIAAPGENLVTAYPGGGWALASGTSFAAPWISGGIAVFADKNGKGGQPGRADYYFAAAALSHALPVHGARERSAGHGRTDLKRAVDHLEKP